MARCLVGFADGEDAEVRAWLVLQLGVGASPGEFEALLTRFFDALGVPDDGAGPSASQAAAKLVVWWATRQTRHEPDPDPLDFSGVEVAAGPTSVDVTCRVICPPTGRPQLLGELAPSRR